MSKSNFDNLRAPEPQVGNHCSKRHTDINCI